MIPQPTRLEGEAISWHVLEVVTDNARAQGHKIERVVFNASTKQAVTDARKHPRQIDGPLVDATWTRPVRWTIWSASASSVFGASSLPGGATPQGRDELQSVADAGWSEDRELDDREIHSAGE